MNLKKIHNTRDWKNQVGNWIATCDEEVENEFLTDKEILQNILNERKEGETCDEEKEEMEGAKFAHVELRNTLHLATIYVEQQEISTAFDIILIKKWRDYAFKIAIKGKKQKKISDCFDQ